MQIKHSTESKYTEIKDLKSGDVFLFEENAYMVADDEDCAVTPLLKFICIRLDNGYLEKFNGDALVLPMIQSLLEVRP